MGSRARANSAWLLFLLTYKENAAFNCYTNYQYIKGGVQQWVAFPTIPSQRAKGSPLTNRAVCCGPIGLTGSKEKDWCMHS